MSVLATSFLQDRNFIDVCYIVAFSLFILGLMQLRGPRTAVRGNATAAVGMAIAVAVTLLTPGMGNWGLIILGVAIGTAVGIPAARNVQSLLELIAGEDGQVDLNFDDEIIAGACITKETS